jgi:L-fuconolactonase
LAAARALRLAALTFVPFRCLMPARTDAHQHFWRIARGDCVWLRPDLPALAPICRDFLPADFDALRRAGGVSRSVLVQATDSVAETDFLLELATATPFVAGVVGWVDLSLAESVVTITRWSEHVKFKGLRPMLQDLDDVNWIATAPHPAVIRAMQDLGLRLDALVKPAHLAPLLKFLRDWPELPVVIDHAAKPALAQGWRADWAPAWRSALAAIAAMPQVSCKFSGLLTEAAPGSLLNGATALATVRPVWDFLLQSFGPQRLMWGSDWPVLNLASDYSNWLELSQTLIDELAPAEQKMVWNGCAERFYSLVDLTEAIDRTI